MPTTESYDGFCMQIAYKCEKKTLHLGPNVFISESLNGMAIKKTFAFCCKNKWLWKVNDDWWLTRYDGFCVLFVFIKLALTSIMLSLVTKQQIEVNNYFMRIVFVVFSFYYQVSVLINSVTHLNFHMTPWHIYISDKWKFGHLDPCLELSLLLSTFTNISVWVWNFWFS